MKPRAVLKVIFGTVLTTGILTVLPSSTSVAEAATNAAWTAAFGGVQTGGGSTLVSGALSAHGNPSVGATVVLWAERRDGSDPVAVSRATTNSSGHWSLSIPPGTDLTFARNPQTQQINFFVESFDGIGSSNYYFPAIVGSTTTDPADAATHAASDSTVVVAQGGSLSGKPIGLWVDGQQTNAVNLTSTDAPNAVDSAPVPNGGAAPKTVCTNTQIGSSNVWSQIAYLASEAWGSAEHLVYNYGASTQLGVGVQVPGGWSAAGTVSVSAGITANFPAIHNAQYVDYLAETHAKLVKRTCRGPGVSNSHNLLQADYMTGGLKYAAASRVGMSQCVVGAARTTVTANRSHAATFGGGFNVSSIIGINLSAQTGFSSGTSIDFAFGNQSHPWCGLDAYPGRVGADPHKFTIHSSVIS